MIKILENAYGLNLADIGFVFMAVFVIAGIVGFVYEELFYRIDLKKWIKRGATFGPWILIYSAGGILLALIVYHLRAHWILVFLVSAGITGVIEYVSGYVILKLTGKRYWDYNTEIWSWGNIGGFVAARSVILFGIGGVALVYLIYPIVIRVYASPSGQVWRYIMMVLFFIYIFDLILHRALGIPVYYLTDEWADDDSKNDDNKGDNNKKEKTRVKTRQS